MDKPRRNTGGGNAGDGGDEGALGGGGDGNNVNLVKSRNGTKNRDANRKIVENEGHASVLPIVIPDCIEAQCADSPECLSNLVSSSHA